MNKTDLQVAIRVAEKSCLSAQKEAAWAREALTESEDEHRVVEDVQQLIWKARTDLQMALDLLEQS